MSKVPYQVFDGVISSPDVYYQIYKESEKDTKQNKRVINEIIKSEQSKHYVSSEGNAVLESYNSNNQMLKLRMK